MLTDAQRINLDRAVHEYLLSSSHSAAASAFALSCSSLSDLPPPPPTEAGAVPPSVPPSVVPLLEKKWVAVVRLQKKVMELESLSSVNPTSAPPPSSSCPLPTDTPPPLLLHGHHPNTITSLSLHPTHPLCASSNSAGAVLVHNTETGQYLHTLRGHTASVQTVTYNPKGTTLATASSDLSIKLWDTETNECTRTMRGHDHTVTGVAFIPPAADVLATSSRDGTVKFWSVKTGYVLHTFTSHGEWVRCLAVSCCGEEVSSGGSGGDVVVHAVGKREVRGVLKGHTHVVESVAYPPLPKPGAEAVDLLLATGGRDKTVRLWNTSTLSCLHVYTSHSNWVRTVLFPNHPHHILTVSDDHSLMVHSLSTGRTVRKIEEAHGHFVSALAVGGGGDAVVTGGVDGVAKVWKCR